MKQIININYYISNYTNIYECPFCFQQKTDSRDAKYLGKRGGLDTTQGAYWKLCKPKTLTKMVKKIISLLLIPNTYLNSDITHELNISHILNFCIYFAKAY